MTEVAISRSQIEISPSNLLVPESFVYTKKDMLEEVRKAVNGRRYPGYPQAGLKMTEQEFAQWERADRPVEKLIGTRENPTPFFVGAHENRYLPNGSKRNPHVQEYGPGISFPASEFGSLATASDGSPLHPFFKEIVTSPTDAGFVTGLGWYWVPGENEAADPFIHRAYDGKLQFIAIKRHIDKVFALPGGMKEGDKGLSKTATKAMELSNDTASREGNEETGVVGLEKVPGRTILELALVGDPRLTAQAWPVTTVVRFALPPELAMSQKLKAGDDAIEVAWMDANDEKIDSLFASHPSYVRLSILDYQNETGLVVDKGGNIGRPSESTKYFT